MNIELLCAYDKTIFRDEKTGFTVFYVRTREIVKEFDDKLIKCKGYIPAFAKNVPLNIKGIVAEDKVSKYVNIKKWSVCAKEQAAAIAFLTDKQFDGVGEKTAIQIVSASGEDIFRFCAENKDAASVYAAASKSLTQQQATALVNKIRKYTQMEELLLYLSTFGGTCEDAETLYKEYGAEAIERIRKNPYVLYKADISYELREALAKKIGISTLNRKRVLALIYECFDRAAKAGHTCLTPEKLLKMARYIEKSANMGYHTNPLYIFSIICEEKKSFVIHHEETGKIQLYRRNCYEMEQRAARHIVRLVKGGRPHPVDTVTIEEIEKECGIVYEEHQKDAFNLMRSGGIRILTGGPGTGKSTVIRGLLAYYRKMFPQAEIALCAPTGAASKRMREVTGEHAQTIHKLLDVRPFGSGMQYRDEYDQLPYDLIIADEFSMVDTELLMMLVSSIKTGALLLIVGDEDQLAPVGIGNTLHDMMDNNLIDVCRLTKVFRQDGRSAILDNSIKVRAGEEDLSEDENFEIIPVQTEEEMFKKAIELMKNGYDANNLARIKLYTPVKSKKYMISTAKLNSEMHNLFNPGLTESLVYNGTVFSEGDPIVMTRNNYAMHYMNGDEGVVYKIRTTKSGHTEMEVCIDNAIIKLSGKTLADVNLGYALTIHKAQGSECDNAIVLLPETPSNMLEKSMLYVAITRARKKDYIIAQGDALKTAISTDKKQERETGLNSQIASFTKLASKNERRNEV